MHAYDIPLRYLALGAAVGLVAIANTSPTDDETLARERAIETEARCLEPARDGSRYVYWDSSDTCVEYRHARNLREVL